MDCDRLRLGAWRGHGGICRRGISGAHLNPAVTLGLAFVGDFPWKEVPSYILGQMIGAFLGAVLVFLHYLPHWKETEDQGAKLGVFSTGPAIPNTFANLFSETLGTFVLVLGLLAIGANKFTDGLNPLVVGFLIVAIGISLGGTTGYAINPARDLGPRIAHFVLPIAGKGSSNWKYAWIPVLGPALGGSFAGVFLQRRIQRAHHQHILDCKRYISCDIVRFLYSYEKTVG